MHYSQAGPVPGWRSLGSSGIKLPLPGSVTRTPDREEQAEIAGAEDAAPGFNRGRCFVGVSDLGTPGLTAAAVRSRAVGDHDSLTESGCFVQCHL